LTAPNAQRRSKNGHVKKRASKRPPNHQLEAKWIPTTPSNLVGAVCAQTLKFHTDKSGLEGDMTAALNDRRVLGRRCTEGDNDVPGASPTALAFAQKVWCNARSLWGVTSRLGFGFCFTSLLPELHGRFWA
jgi:hypothetical protein